MMPQACKLVNWLLCLALAQTILDDFQRIVIRAAELGGNPHAPEDLLYLKGLNITQVD